MVNLDLKFSKNSFQCFLILGIALLLRLTGVTYGLPDLYHQDEPIVVNHALLMGVNGLNPNFFILPPFVMYIVFGLSGVYFVLGNIIGIFSSSNDFLFYFLSDPTLVYLLGRLGVGVLFGVLTVCLLLCFKLPQFNSHVSVWAGAFLAVFWTHVRHSHYIYADIPLAFAVTALLFVSVRYLHTNKKSHLILMAVILGWGTSIKYTMLYFSLSIALSVILNTSSRLISKIIQLAAVALLSFATFFILAPYTFLNWTHFLSDIKNQSEAQWYVGPVHHLTYSLGGGLGWILLCLGVLGIFILLRKNIRESMVWIFPICCYYLIMVFFSQPFERYMIPLIPMLCMFAAYGLFHITDILKAQIYRKLIVVIIIAFLAAPSLYGVWLFSKKDTRTQSFEWFQSNIPEGTGVALTSRTFSPRLWPTRQQVLEKYNYLEGSSGGGKRLKLDMMQEIVKSKKAYTMYTLSFNLENEKDAFLFDRPYLYPSIESLKEKNVKYIIFNTRERLDEFEPFLKNISEDVRLIKSFVPYWDSEKKYTLDRHDQTAAPHLLSELFSRKALGPYIEIYEVLS